MKYRVNASLRTAIVLADLMLLTVALYAATRMAARISDTSPHGRSLLPFDLLNTDWGVLVTVCTVWICVTLVLGTYRAVQNRLAYQEFGHLLKAALVGGLLMAGLLFLTTVGASRLRFLWFFALLLPLLMIFRLALRMTYRLVFGRAWGTAMIAPARVVVVGEGSVLYDTLCTLSDSDPREVAVLGYVDYQEDLADAVGAPARADSLHGDVFITGPLETNNAQGGSAEPDENGILVPAYGYSREDAASNVAPVTPFPFGGSGSRLVTPRAEGLSMLTHASASAKAAARWGLSAGEARRSKEKEEVAAQQETVKTLGAVIENLVSTTRADNVVVAISRKYHRLLSNVVAELQRLPVHIVLMPDVADLTILNVGVTELCPGSPALKLRAPILTDVQLALKRCLDLAIVIPLLPFLIPLLGCVALAIRLDSPGPILFKQRRVGQFGKQFTIYKFRTMVQDAEARLREVTTYTEEGKPMFKSEQGDPRITRVGRVLRRLSLDELPQLFNVLMGQMSLVGPRPELPRYVGFYETWQHFRLWVPPGITGWWQIRGREKQPMYMHWDDDLYYIRNYSLLLDLQILWLTISHALLGSTGR